MKLYMYIICVLVLGAGNAYGQGSLLNTYKIGTGSYYINDSLTIKETDLFHNYKSDFGLSNSDEMVRTNNEVLEDGKFRSHYLLFNHGIRVQGSMINVLGEQGIVERINGFWVGGTDVDTTHLISKDSAISAAIQYMGAVEYSWEDTSVADSLRIYPTDAKLIIAHKAGTDEGFVNNYALCYEVQLTSIDPGGSKDVFVDAHTGAGFTMQDAFVNEHSVNNGTLWTWYDGYHSDLTSTTCNACFNFWLRDLDRGIQTISYKFRKKYLKPWTLIKDNNNNWVESDTKTAASAQWETERAKDYFTNVQGVANSGDRIFVWTNSPASAFGGSYPNSGYLSWFYSGHNYDVIGLTTDNINYTPPNDGYSLAMLGVMGHEYTHAMVHGSSDLGSLSPPNQHTEADALNEGFADIFGVMIRRYTTGYNGWILGEHTIDGKRHLDDPHLDSHPSPEIYQEPGYWTNEPHAAGGVLRKWFYLLSEGGTFNGITVQGVGTTTAARIAFVTFEWWLWSNVTYPEAANALVWETIADWGGNCSFVTQQNIFALEAVGFDVPGFYCANNIHLRGAHVISTRYHVTEEKSWSVNLGEGVKPNGTYNWNYPPDWTAHVSGNSLIVNRLTDFGSYNPGLIKVTYTEPGGHVYKDSLWVRFSDVAWTPTDTSSSLQQYMPVKPVENSNNMEVYPNPAGNFVRVKTPIICDNALLSIFDMRGIVVKSQRVNGSKIRVDIHQLPAGLYFIKLQTGNHLFTQKFSIIR